jgi:hypothetical protein
VPPLGVVHLRPIIEPRSFLAKGRVVGARYVSEPLGLSVEMRGFERVDPGHGQLTEMAELVVEGSVVRARNAARLSFVLVPLFAPLTPEVEQRLVWTVVDTFHFEGDWPAFEGGESFDTDAGPARALRWSLRPQGMGTLAIVFIPVCEGKITLLALALGPQFDDMRAARRWLQSLRFDDASPACRFAREDGP